MFDGSENVTIPLNYATSTSGNIKGPYGGTFNCTRVGNLVVTSYTRPDNISGTYPTFTQSNESIPELFRPVVQVEGSGTDNKGGPLALSLLSSGKVTTRNSTIPDKVGALISRTYIAAN